MKTAPHARIVIGMTISGASQSSRLVSRWSGGAIVVYEEQSQIATGTEIGQAKISPDAACSKSHMKRSIFPVKIKMINSEIIGTLTINKKMWKLGRIVLEEVCMIEENESDEALFTLTPLPTYLVARRIRFHINIRSE